ncbi:hypothetical protein BG003_008104 [Podila horticola]|nr:hypothetical protein BG003_008104 [Podila horticola]
MIRRLMANGSEDKVSVNGFQPTISLEETRLQVPSLQVLNMLGHWAICDAVLEIMLAQVFRNVRNLEEMYCTGFNTLKWLQLTQQMPWLLRAESRRALGMDPVPIEALPESLLTTHVQYIFDTLTSIKYIGPMPLTLGQNGATTKLPTEIILQILYHIDDACASDQQWRNRVLTYMRVCKNCRHLVEDLVIDMQGSTLPTSGDASDQKQHESDGTSILYHLFQPHANPHSSSHDPKSDTRQDIKYDSDKLDCDDIGDSLLLMERLASSPAFSLPPTPIHFPNLETLELHRIDFSGHKPYYLRSILDGLPVLRHLVLNTLTNVNLDKTDLVLLNLQSLVINLIQKSCRSLVHILSVRCTPHVDRVKLHNIHGTTRSNSPAHTQVLDLLLEHGPVDDLGRQKSLPIRYIDGLDCIRYSDEVLASFFERLPAGSLRTFSVQNGRLMGMKSLDSLIRHHKMSIETLYFDSYSPTRRDRDVFVQNVITKFPNLLVLGLMKRRYFHVALRYPWICPKLQLRHEGTITMHGGMQCYGNADYRRQGHGMIRNHAVAATSVMGQRRFGARGAIGRERGQIQRTIHDPDKGTFQFCG